MSEQETSTISSIAAEAGVSVPTVSKVLNGRSDVAAATRARVEEIVAKHGYRRRNRGPVRSGPPMIDLVFHEITNEWSMEIIRAVEETAGAAGAGMVLSELGGRHRPAQDWLDNVLARRPLGVILVLARLTDAQHDQLESRQIPSVVVDTDGEPRPGVPAVGSTNWDGGLAATKHLIGLGHRRIAVISGQPDVLCSRARVDGYRSALDQAGIAYDPALVRWGDFYIWRGEDHARDLLSREDRPTAIFAGSDMQAVGVLRAARELGLRVPEDLSVVGYDDLPIASWYSPTLTTVHQPLRQMAATATQMVLTLSRGEQPSALRVDLATELVVRESTGPPPESA
ncbi:LacI family DNA-binding transcriptional regulator [Ruania halotolerans]|uniref:LacI family DNA-binding transcriptional regulator n=1 Tax=Ruania halotolerans TaxID=2897773 RepID=UPI001E409A32|nr:LacI family DNA-binding transcriptional regulator [Ruania halotolerans]UFU07854.1 LacI family DNA-binding transcriptional regulator [Ruania halotolerans]